MDEAARLRVIIEALGLRQTQRGLRQLDGDLRRSDRASRDLSRSARSSAASLSRLGRAAAVGGVAGLSIGLGAAVKSGFKFNAQMESNELAMRRFIGSTKQTRRYLNDLAVLAEKSPFELTQLTQGARRLLAFGVSARQTKDTLTAVADAIAAAGGGAERIDQVTLALGQMQVKGKVSGEELLQLNEAGIPATKILRRELGLTGKEVGNIGNLGIKSGVAIKALTQGMTKDFGGASREQARTWDGLTSTLRDKWARMTGSLTRGLFQEAKKWVPTVSQTFDQMGRIFRRKDLNLGEKLKLSFGVVQRNIIDPIRRKLGELQIGDKMSAAFERAAPRVLNAMGTLARRAVGAFVHAWANAGPWARWLSIAFLAHKLGAFNAFGRRAANRFTNSFENRASSSFMALGGAASSGKGKMGGAIASFGKSIGVTLAVAAALEFGVRFHDEIATVLSDAGDWIKGAVGNIGDAFDEVLPKSPQERRSERALRPGVGPARAGLTPTLGGFPKRWNNPNEGGARMRNAVMHPKTGGKNKFADLRIKRNATNTRIQNRADSIQFQLDMGKITTGAAADQLDALAGGVKHNKRLRRQLLVSAHQLREQSRQDAQQQSEDTRRAADQRRRNLAAKQAAERRKAQSERRAALSDRQRAIRAAKTRAKRRGGGSNDFELNVGDVRVPTVYEVRRTRLERGNAHGRPGVLGSSSQPTTIHNGDINITIDGAGKRAKEIAEETMAVIRHRERTAGAAAKRAKGRRRGR